MDSNTAQNNSSDSQEKDSIIKPGQFVVASLDDATNTTPSPNQVNALPPQSPIVEPLKITQPQEAPSVVPPLGQNSTEQPPPPQPVFSLAGQRTYTPPPPLAILSPETNPTGELSTSPSLPPLSAQPDPTPFNPQNSSVPVAQGQNTGQFNPQSPKESNIFKTLFLTLVALILLGLITFIVWYFLINGKLKEITKTEFVDDAPIDEIEPSQKPGSKKGFADIDKEATTEALPTPSLLDSTVLQEGI